jgi:hypothetical protein
MRKVLLLLTAASITLCFSCSPTVNGWNGYIPIAGLSFGMSVEDALMAVPYLKQTEGSSPEIIEFLLEDTVVYGETAAVRLRFEKWYDSAVGEDGYIHDAGLQEIHIMFLRSVKTDTIMSSLEDKFDFEWETGWEERYYGGIELLSKSRVKDMDDHMIDKLRDYFAHWPVVRSYDGHIHYADYSVVIGRVLGADTNANDLRYSLPKYQHLVFGSYDTQSRELSLYGFMAGCLYNALQ